MFFSFKNWPPERNHNPAVFWVLILLLMLTLGGSVKLFGKTDYPESGTPTPTPEDVRIPRFYTVTYSRGVFSPTNLRIHAGDTVRFKNESFFGIRILTDNNQLPGFDSVGDIPQSSYFSYTFSEKGIFGYHNQKNPDEQGTIIVR